MITYVAVRRIADAEDRTLADIGDVCTRVPAAAIDGLVAGGDVRAIDAPAPVVDASAHEGGER